ncbi:MAG: glycosyltransferase family 2 protein [Caldilineaceae bacterium]
MQKKPIDASVVICCYTEERWHYLEKAIASVKAQTCTPREVIVVVDHNPEMLRRVQTSFDNITVIENAELRGASGGRNSAIAVAQGEIIVFLDDDAVADPDWLEHLMAAFTSPDVLGVGGTTDTYWETGRPWWFPIEFDWVVGCTYRGVPTNLSPIRNLIAANMSTRRSVFERVGSFRSGFGRTGKNPIAAEETELCIRAQQQWPNGHFLFEPKARVYQHVPPARSDWKYFQSRCYAEGISKALVVKHVGANDGLSAERTYTLFVLPTGMLYGVWDALKGDLGGLGRAAAIFVGLLFTTCGYIAGTVQNKMTSWRQLFSPAGQLKSYSDNTLVQKGG